MPLSPKSALKSIRGPNLNVVACHPVISWRTSFSAASTTARPSALSRSSPFTPVGSSGRGQGRSRLAKYSARAFHAPAMSPRASASLAARKPGPVILRAAKKSPSLM